MNISVKSPKSKNDFLKYYNFRWELLRKPYNQPKGSECDNLEDISHHIMLTTLKNIIGVGRIHFIRKNNNKIAQIRYMAVDNKYRKKGIGTLILKELESHAIKNNIIEIFLNSRQSAIDFYRKNGYLTKNKTHILFNEIEHWHMEKKIK